MTAEAAFTRTWRVGAWTVTLTSPPPVAGQARGAAIEWHPGPPPRLSGALLKQYRRGRDAALADLARDLGLSIAIVEV
jgi:hypothetical protein